MKELDLLLCRAHDQIWRAILQRVGWSLGLKNNYVALSKVYS
jgi:hypothetical protein